MQNCTLQELVNTYDPAWSIIQKWMREARNAVEVIRTERERSTAVLLHLQVTTRSLIGAIALESGGILIDRGWMRFLGGGDERICGNLLSWNSQSDMLGHRYIKDALIVAYDVIGGFFALNSGAFPGKLGTIFYFAPDRLQWEDTNKSYSDLLQWAFSGNVSLFHEKMRWLGWENDLAVLSGDQGISIYPFVFLDRNISIADRSRRAVPLYELWDLYRDLAQQLGDLPTGTPIQFVIEKEKDL